MLIVLMVKCVGLMFVLSSVIVVEYGFFFVEYGVFRMCSMCIGLCVSFLFIMWVSVIKVLWFWKNYVLGIISVLIRVCCFLGIVFRCS